PPFAPRRYPKAQPSEITSNRARGAVEDEHGPNGYRSSDCVRSAPSVAFSWWEMRTAIIRHGCGRTSVDSGGEYHKLLQDVKESNRVQAHRSIASLPLFHGGNTGSNPVGDAIYINGLRHRAETSVPLVSRTGIATELSHDCHR